MKDYGPGYGWSEPYLEIGKGDSVRWSWRPPNGISQVKFKIAQVEDANSFNEIGFTSGEPTRVGSYEYQFNQAGLFFYWSGSVESSGQIFFRGVISVVDSSDKTLELNVSLNGFYGMLTDFNY